MPSENGTRSPQSIPHQFPSSLDKVHVDKQEVDRNKGTLVLVQLEGDVTLKIITRIRLPTVGTERQVAERCGQ